MFEKQLETIRRIIRDSGLDGYFDMVCRVEHRHQVKRSRYYIDFDSLDSMAIDGGQLRWVELMIGEGAIERHCNIDGIADFLLVLFTNSEEHGYSYQISHVYHIGEDGSSELLIQGIPSGDAIDDLAAQLRVSLRSFNTE